MENLNTHLTEVTTRQTSIKYFDEQNNTVSDVIVVGKLNITEAKDYLKSNGLGIFISKEDVKDTFKVETVQLLLLKQVL